MPELDIITYSKLKKLEKTLNAISVAGTVDEWHGTSLIDNGKRFAGDELKDKIIVFAIDRTNYYTTVTGCSGASISFLPIAIPDNATVTIGSGEDEGQAVIECIGDLTGSAGNEYSVEVVAGETDTGDKIASLTDKVLTLFVDTNGMGAPQDLMAGDVEGMLTTAGIGDKFSVQSMKPGTLPLDITDVFAGGDDGIVVNVGDKYYILAFEDITQLGQSVDDISSQLAAMSQLQQAWTPKNYQKKLGVCIEDCSSVTGWMANTPYVTAPILSDEHLFEQKSIKFTIGTSGWKGIGVGIDYDFTNVTTIGIAMKIPEEHTFDSVLIRFTTEASKANNLYNNWTKYFECTLGSASKHLHSGWNYIKLHKDAFTNVGDEEWGIFKAINFVFSIPAYKFLNTFTLSDIVNSPVDWHLGGIYLNPTYETPKLMIEFDDSQPTLYANGFPYMRKKGVRATMNVCRNHVYDIGPTYMTAAQHDELYAAGWDMCAHSTTHDSEWEMTEAQITTEWTTILEWLLDRGYTRSAFFGAYPQGRYNTTIMNVLKALGFKMMRGRNVRLIHHMTADEMLCFPTYEITGTTTQSDLFGWVDLAILQQSSMCIFTHGIVASNPDAFNTSIATFQAFIDYVVEKRDAGLLDIVTNSEFYAGLSNKTIEIPEIVTM